MPSTSRRNFTPIGEALARCLRKVLGDQRVDKALVQAAR